jgi:hypothetical protein
MRSVYMISAVVAVLAMASHVSAVSLSVVQGDDPVAGFRAFTVEATGVGINQLSKFTISGIAVRQTSTNSAWTGNGTAGGPTDSYIMFGDLRFGNVTTETIVGDGGTLNNYDPVHGWWDAYLKTGSSWLDQNLTVDLFHLVLRDSSDTTVNVRLLTVTGPDYMTVTEYNLTASIYAPVDGDCDKDGDVDMVDFGAFRSGWLGLESPSWAYGDFDDDGNVGDDDYQAFGAGWISPRGPGGDVPAVPEPSTIVMLVLGALCLASYRLHK